MEALISVAAVLVAGTAALRLLPPRQRPPGVHADAPPGDDPDAQPDGSTEGRAG